MRESTCDFLNLTEIKDNFFNILILKLILHAAYYNNNLNLIYLCA